MRNCLQSKKRLPAPGRMPLQGPGQRAGARRPAGDGMIPTRLAGLGDPWLSDQRHFHPSRRIVNRVLAPGCSFRYPTGRFIRAWPTPDGSRCVGHCKLGENAWPPHMWEIVPGTAWGRLPVMGHKGWSSKMAARQWVGPACAHGRPRSGPSTLLLPVVDRGLAVHQHRRLWSLFCSGIICVPARAQAA